MHLVLIFGFLVSPAGKEAVAAANRSVAVLLMPATNAPLEAATGAPADQHGRSVPPDGIAQAPPMAAHRQRTPALNTATQPAAAIATQAASSHQPGARVSARAALEAEYVRHWQVEIERFGNAQYRDTAKRHGNGDVRLRVRVGSNGGLQDIQVLSTSGVAALDRVAIETVERLAPFNPFPPALANSMTELDIIRTWQFRY